MTDRSETHATAPSAIRREVRAAGELVALSGLAITQPILDVFGRAPEHLLLRGVDGWGLVTFGLITAFAVPLGLWALEAVVGLVSSRARSVVHAASLWVLVVVLVTLLTDGVLERGAALAAGALVATAFVLLHHRTRGPAIWLAFLTPAPLAFLALFLFASPAAPLLRDQARALDTGVGAPTRTVIVLFDELPTSTLLEADGEIDHDLFPNFGRLADTSTWFRQTVAVGNYTKLVIPSLLTGHEATGGSASSGSYPNNLFTLVGGSMPVVSSEAITRMCPSSVCEDPPTSRRDMRALLDDAATALRQRLDPSDPDIEPVTDIVDRDAAAPGDTDGEPDEQAVDELPERRPDDAGSNRLDRFLSGLNEDPGLHFLHLMVPHHAYEFLPDGTRYERPSGAEPAFDLGVWVAEPDPVELTFRRYLLQLQRADAMLGRILDRLDEPEFRDTHLVVLADHGFGYEPGDTFRAWTPDQVDGDTAMAEIMWVPFFVRTAGQTEGAVSDAPIRNLDLTPTIADLLDVDIPWEHTGRSVFEGGSGDPVVATMAVGEDPDALGVPGPPHRIDRDRAWELLLDRTTGSIIPPPGEFTGSERIFAVGPRPELLGEPVPRGSSAVPVGVNDVSRADDVDPASGVVPALFLGVVDLPVGTEVAVAVDGTVRATTTVHALRGEHRVDALLPPESFRPGDNELTVHRLSPG